MNNVCKTVWQFKPFRATVGIAAPCHPHARARSPPRYPARHCTARPPARPLHRYPAYLHPLQTMTTRRLGGCNRHWQHVCACTAFTTK